MVAGTEPRACRRGVVINVGRNNSPGFAAHFHAVGPYSEQKVVAEKYIPYKADGRYGHDAPRIAGGNHGSGAIIGLFFAEFLLTKGRLLRGGNQRSSTGVEPQKLKPE